MAGGKLFFFLVPTVFKKKNRLLSSHHRHIMTGLGAYLYIIWGIWLRHCLNGRQEEYYLRWPHTWNIPEVIRVTEVQHENGSVKKSN